MAPKIIAVCNTKGGTGKTTVAVQIAIARLRQGKKVWFVDGDRQQTGAMAMTMRLNHRGRRRIPFATYPDGKSLQFNVRNMAEQFDTVVIDVGGFDATTMRAAMMICDVLLIPFQPRSFDSWALSKMDSLLEDVMSLRGSFPVYAMINCADPNGVDNKEAEEALNDFSTMKFLPCAFGRRKAFSTSAGYGLNVEEIKVRDQKALNELSALMIAIFGEPLKGKKDENVDSENTEN
ncbi:AAA family ATPase [Parasutterella muris]|uniref:AAA family ATPase n=1 Tax=Parasutterella muris TaxID=2565572 RepID=UPI0020422FEA|nr:AAA family ATPase [Parasutterella muris]